MLNKLIESSGKYNPKSNTYFPSLSISEIVKAGRNTFQWIQNMSAIYDKINFGK